MVTEAKGESILHDLVVDSVETCLVVHGSATLVLNTLKHRVADLSKHVGLRKLTYSKRGAHRC